MTEKLLDGRYRLEAEIARGAIGTVFRGTDTTTGAPVAVKLLRSEVAEVADLVTGFTAEAEVLSELDHPSVVRVRDFVSNGSEHALVMELIVGLDLRRRVRAEGPLPPAVAANVVAQVADALAYVHGRGIVHGDVKPGNLLVPDDGGPVRLADFGVARRLDRPAGPTHATPEYVAPEVVGGASPTAAADVYALGIVLFELLCGRSPFRGGTPTEVLDRHVSCAVVPPPGMPAAVWPVIEACLQVDPAARPTAGALAERLRTVEAALDGLDPLSPLQPGALTFWARAADQTAPIVAPVRRVDWVPMPSAPVSPAPGYARLMVAVPASPSGEPADPTEISAEGPTVPNPAPSEEPTAVVPAVSEEPTTVVPAAAAPEEPTTAVPVGTASGGPAGPVAVPAALTKSPATPIVPIAAEAVTDAAEAAADADAAPTTPILAAPAAAAGSAAAGPPGYPVASTGPVMPAAGAAGRRPGGPRRRRLLAVAGGGVALLTLAAIVVGVIVLRGPAGGDGDGGRQPAQAGVTESAVPAPSASGASAAPDSGQPGATPGDDPGATPGNDQAGGAPGEDTPAGGDGGDRGPGGDGGQPTDPGEPGSGPGGAIPGFSPGQDPGIGGPVPTVPMP